MSIYIDFYIYRGLLKIGGSAVLEAHQWHTISFSLRDTSSYVRNAVLKKFKSIFVKYGVRPQFMCALALVGDDATKSKVH